MEDEAKFQRGVKGWDGKPELGESSWIGTRKQWSGWWRNGPLGDKLYGAFVLGALAMLWVMYFTR